MTGVSKVLSNLVKAKGLSSSSLARLTGVPQPVVYRLINGSTENPQILTLKPIADYFEISIDQLMGYAQLNNSGLDRQLLHDINNRLTTIKTVAVALTDMVPILQRGYITAVSANIMEEELPVDIMPLLEHNIGNLIKASQFIKKSLSADNNADKVLSN